MVYSLANEVAPLADVRKTREALIIGSVKVIGTYSACTVDFGIH